MSLEIEPRPVPAAFLTSELGRNATRRALTSGEYTSVRRGALVAALPEGERWEEDEARAMAAIASVDRKLTNGAVFSHGSAALIHGLWLNELPALPTVTQRHKPNAHGARSLERHCDALPRGTVTTVGTLRVTTIERTIVDCARTMHPRDALVVADSGMRALIRADRFTRDADVVRVADLRTRLLKMVEQGSRRGRRQARAVINAADPYAESPKESVLRWIVVSRGLPVPETQLAVRTRGGIFYADLGWKWRAQLADGRVVFRTLLLEYDGELKYLPGGGLVTDVAGSAQAVVAEKRREDLLREDPGTTILRFARHDLRDPDRVFARLLAAVPAGVRTDLKPIPELIVGSYS